MSNDINRRIGAILRDARNRQSMSQEHLADAADISVKTVRRAELGERVSGEKLRALCAVLGLDATDVIAQSERGGRAFRVYQREHVSDWRFGPEQTEAAAIFFGQLSCLFGAMLAMGVVERHGGPSVDAFVAFLAVTASVMVVLFAIPHLGTTGVIASQDRQSVRIEQQWPVLLATIAVATAALATDRLTVDGYALVVAAGLIVYWGLTGREFLAAIRRKQERCAALSAARTALAEDGSAHIARLRGLAADRLRGGVLDEAEALLTRYQDLADRAEHWCGCAALECFLEDLANGISGTAGLMDYLSVAERLDGAATLSQREAQDAARALAMLRHRVSLIAPSRVADAVTA